MTRIGTQRSKRSLLTTTAQVGGEGFSISYGDLPSDGIGERGLARGLTAADLEEEEPATEAPHALEEDEQEPAIEEERESA